MKDSLYDSDEAGYDIAQKLGYEVDKLLSSEANNYNGHVYLLTNGQVMKVSLLPCFKMVEDIRKADFMPKIHKHIKYIENLSHREDMAVSIYIRDNIDDLPEQAYNFTKLLDSISAINYQINSLYKEQSIPASYYKHLIRDSLMEEDGYDDLTEEQKALMNECIDAIGDFYQATNLFYVDTSCDNFGVYNGKVVVRDLEGYANNNTQEEFKGPLETLKEDEVFENPGMRMF